MINWRSYYLISLEKAIAFLLLVYPSALLLVKGGMNGAMILMLLFAVFVRVLPPADLVSPVWRKEWWIYVAAMFGMTAAILISQIAHHDLLARPHDAASRYWLALPIFWMLLHMRTSVFTSLQYAFPLAAILGCLFAEDKGNGFTLALLNKILFGDYILLLGTLSLFSVDWFGKDSLWLRSLKWSGFAFGIFAALQSGTRGALLAIPVFIGIYIYFRHSRLSYKTILSSLAIGVAVIGIAYFSSQTVQQRLQILSSDVTTYEEGNRDTSTGIRWQLNIAAVEIFLHHPIVGVGPEVVGGKHDGFAKEIQKMYAEGRLTAGAAEVGICCQAHNEILAKAADLGVLGLVAILALYFVPMYLFWRASQFGGKVARRAAMLGLTLVSGHFVFGFTVGFLGLTMTAAFYAFSVAVLLAACYNTHDGEQIAVHKSE